MTVGLQAAMLDWQDAPDRVRRLRRRLDERGLEAFRRAEEGVFRELVRRLGPGFTLGGLYREYERADDWARMVVSDELGSVSIPGAVTPLVDLAFGRMSGSARDGR